MPCLRSSTHAGARPPARRAAVVARAAAAETKTKTKTKADAGLMSLAVDDDYGYVSPEKAKKDGYEGFVYAQNVKPDDFFSITYIRERVLASLPSIFTLLLLRVLFQSLKSKHDDNTSLKARSRLPTCCA
jgi:hypothetical protein